MGSNGDYKEVIEVSKCKTLYIQGFRGEFVQIEGGSIDKWLTDKRIL